MPEISDPEIEGRLLAHRRVLSYLIVEVLRRADDGDALRDFLRNATAVQDGQEDPGAVPDPAFAIEAARADELRHLRDETDRLFSFIESSRD